MIGAQGQAEADTLVKASLDGGINFFDTADVYTEGESEKILGQSLKNLKVARKDVVIATRVYVRVGKGRNDVGASRGHIMDAVEASLRRLQIDHIDLYQIHGNDAITPVEETLRALDTLVQQGKVRYIGCSNWQAWKNCRKSLAHLRVQEPCSVRYSPGLLLDRRPRIGKGTRSPDGSRESWAARLESAGRRPAVRKVQPGQPQAGRLAACAEFDCPIVDKERTWKILDVMAPIAKSHGCSAARIGLAWLLAKPVVTSIIIGAKRIDQLHDNLAAFEVKLTPAEIKQQLDEVSTLPPEYPGWMVQFQGSGNRIDPSGRTICGEGSPGRQLNLENIR